MTIQPRVDNYERLLATAAELQNMADLIDKYPAEAQLIMAALEDGLTLGPMRVSEPMTAAPAGTSRVIAVSGCVDGDETCRLDDCAKPADLVITIAGDGPNARRRLWCLDHWTTLGELITAGGATSFDRPALDVISARLSPGDLVGEGFHAATPR
jgi:hypothetical protein